MPSSSSARRSSRSGDVISRNHFSAKQVEELETLYAVCPYPNKLQRMDLISKHPEFANIDSKKIQNWFQNRRYCFLLNELVILIC